MRPRVPRAQSPRARLGAAAADATQRCCELPCRTFNPPSGYDPRVLRAGRPERRRSTSERPERESSPFADTRQARASARFGRRRALTRPDALLAVEAERVELVVPGSSERGRADIAGSPVDGA